jgi:sigma-B regulation protein RsbU (phosphoserine phosphatase)
MSEANPGFLRNLRRRLSAPDRIVLGVAVLAGAGLLLRAAGLSGPQGGLLQFLLVLSSIYFLVRFLGWARGRLLWSLRNRLIVAYLFIAVVPVVLLVGMAGLSAYLIYSQLGAYLLYSDLHDRVEKVAALADVTAALAVADTSLRTAVIRGGDAAIPQRPGRASGEITSLLAGAQKDLPGVRIEFGSGSELLEARGGERFSGIVQEGEQIWLMAVVARAAENRRLLVSAQVPVTSELLESLAPELGFVRLIVTRPARPGDAAGVILRIGERQFVSDRQILTRSRTMPPPAHTFDIEIKGVSKLDAVNLLDPASSAGTLPVFADYSARPSQLNQRLFSSLGELGDLPYKVLIGIGVFFLIIEGAALITGIALTRTITHAVSDLYEATRHVQAGDFSHRVRLERRDQLGVLGESFNQMTTSIGRLIEEQRHRQRLENELAIAQQVQAQLFPRSLPELPGLHLAAICRAARVVSGDYYDCFLLGPHQMGLVVADIAGKGISAALLMASLHAALRSQVVLDREVARDTSEVVRRLNRHLYVNTSEEKYATLFYAVYDAARRTLSYTNAGHFPPFCLMGEQVKKLEAGGLVVGLVEECEYEHEIVPVEPGSVFVAYSDGLIEPENVYGEQFGIRGLIQETQRQRHAPPAQIAESLFEAVEEWGGTAEQADDMTIIVAKTE